MRNLCRVCLKPHSHTKKYQDMCEKHISEPARGVGTAYSLAWVGSSHKCGMCKFKSHGVMALDIDNGTYGHLHCFMSRHGQNIGIISTYKVLKMTDISAKGYIRLEIDEDTSDISEFLTDKLAADMNDINMTGLYLASYPNGSRYDRGLKLNGKELAAVKETKELIKNHLRDLHSDVRIDENKYRIIMEVLDALSTR